MKNKLNVILNNMRNAYNHIENDENVEEYCAKIEDIQVFINGYGIVSSFDSSEFCQDIVYGVVEEHLEESNVIKSIEDLIEDIKYDENSTKIKEELDTTIYDLVDNEYADVYDFLEILKEEIEVIENLIKSIPDDDK